MFKKSRADNSRVASGFTLIELLVVVAIIALLISILLPSLQRAREMSRRTACAANMGGFGRSALTYAEVNKGPLPTADHDPKLTGDNPAGAPNQSATVVGYQRQFKDRSNASGTFDPTVNDGSNTRGWFKLLKGGKGAYMSGKQLICHSARQTVRHLTEGTKPVIVGPNGEEAPAFDFNGHIGEDGLPSGRNATSAEIAEFSYSFAVNLTYVGNIPGETGGATTGASGASGSLLTNTQDPGKAIAADRNPYSNHVGSRKSNTAAAGFDAGGYGIFQYKQGKATEEVVGFSAPPTLAENDGDHEKYKKALLTRKSANSRNHKQDGQNICYLDGHAKWANSPRAGIDDDSIWSNWAYDAGTAFKFKPCRENPDIASQAKNMPCDSEPPTDLEYGRMRAKSRWSTDSVLIP